MAYYEREQRDLVRLNFVEPTRSPLSAASGEALGHVGYFAELIDEWAPEAHADERLYRLGSSVIDAIAAGAPVDALARYFEYWLLRLQGVYPSIRQCPGCGAGLSDGASMPPREDACSCAGPARREDRARGCRAEAMLFLKSATSVAPDRLVNAGAGATRRARARDRAPPADQRASRQGSEVRPRPQRDAAAAAQPAETFPSFCMVTLQQLIFKLSEFWVSRGCLLQQPLDIEMGAGTMHPETFLRVLGPKPWSVAYVQPSRRPADGRFGENPNRLFKHQQFQVILKPAPDEVQQLYLQSLEACGIDLRAHDVRFEEDNWESPTLGAWGIGWQVLFDGQEITQFTYFQQAGGVDLSPISVELTYGIERFAMALQDVDDVYDLEWAPGVKYRDVRHRDEVEQSKYAFGQIDLPAAELHAPAPQRCSTSTTSSAETLVRSNLLLPALDYCLKCSHMFNLLDSSGGIGVTERMAYILRVRQLAVAIAKGWVGEQGVGRQPPQGTRRRLGRRHAHEAHEGCEVGRRRKRMHDASCICRGLRVVVQREAQP